MSGPDRPRRLPSRVDEALARWDLEPDGPPLVDGPTAVVPVRRGHEALALKVTRPGPAVRVEALALRAWEGAGAVRLVAALPAEGVLLLERLDRRTLETVEDDEACETLGRLLGRLRRPAPPRIGRLADDVEDLLDRAGAGSAAPRRIVTRTKGLAEELLPGAPAFLLHTRLDDRRVLRSGTHGWAAVAPAPLSGHPGYEVWPLLRRRMAGFGTGSGLRWSVRHAVGLVADGLGADDDELRSWTLLRAGVEVLRAASAGDPHELTACVALHKALDG